MEAERGVKCNVIRLCSLGGPNVYYIVVGTSSQLHFLEIQFVNLGAAISPPGNTERGRRLMPPGNLVPAQPDSLTRDTEAGR